MLNQRSHRRRIYCHAAGQNDGFWLRSCVVQGLPAHLRDGPGVVEPSAQVGQSVLLEDLAAVLLEHQCC
jgi:hypothetical protein